MNTKIYKRVHTLAESLMSAVQKKDQTLFDNHYSELKTVCEEHENSDKDHPVQWETLADFTEDRALAITIYDKALIKAKAIKSRDFQSSIGFSIATLKLDLGDKTSAIEYLSQAQISSKRIPDYDLKDEINDLLDKLTNS
ncbi:MAG: tetratricopeptide repeat protein [Gammaproteobacteria bacterium]|nr:tetratricopeptide repeat protein [Gammaproteobacteria bacterium]